MSKTARIANLQKFVSLVWRHVRVTASLPAILGWLTMVPVAYAQPSNEKTFATPGEAVKALYDAAKANDQTALSVIFGTSAGELLHSGDDVADKRMIDNYVRRYEQMHRVVIEPDGTATLYVGAENWPTPISLVKTSSGTWYFDVEDGKNEILYRRIGANENDAIEICYALVDAQREYASEVRSGESTKRYAMKFVSDEGKQNGLYWKVASGEPSSPIGPLIAEAASQGYTKQKSSTPFHGYYFRILEKQRAPKGNKEYTMNGSLAQGFAFLAYPAQYRNSGVMTFIVNQDGGIYQKDLGPDTESIASAMTEYNPDDSWDRVDQ
ncbi:MAG TPA: DUF2950 domain-containing protein [Terriglobales bacterium]|nr:DUF2950 domain-containing protein [Terriglobales bacterium]